jgi:uncharacterized protein YceK
MPRRLLALLLSSCLTLTGCGTCADLIGGTYEPEGPFFYRGVLCDVQSGNAVMLLDMPFSAAADTLLIPVGCLVLGIASFRPIPDDQREFMLPPGAPDTNAGGPAALPSRSAQPPQTR